MKLVTKGLTVGVELGGPDLLKIAALYYFEGITYILFDNQNLIRGFNLETGEMVAEIPLPFNGGNQWEGIAMERRSLSHAVGSLRGSNTRTSEQSDDDSELLVHLAFDTPPQVWTFVVKEAVKQPIKEPLPSQIVLLLLQLLRWHKKDEHTI